MIRSVPYLAGLALLGSTALAQEPDAEKVRFFETKVRPVLIAKCLSCHGPDKSKGGLRLDSREMALKGGDSGPAIAPGKVEETLLLDAIGYEDDALKMPPKGKLDAIQIADIRRWVEHGATWPAGDGGAIHSGPLKVTDLDRQHWAFRPIRRTVPPKVGDPEWASPIDAFVRDGI
ncbi:MAG: c-type cytochrome domain-containing protein, partial [Isosphaeraceae bacterium]